MMPFKTSRRILRLLDPWAHYNTDELLSVEREAGALLCIEVHINNNVIPPILQHPSLIGLLIRTGKDKHNLSLDRTLEATKTAKGGIPPRSNSGVMALPAVPPSPMTPVGGRASQYLHNWQQITSDRWVLTIIQRGHTLEFVHHPSPLPPHLQNICVS